jgi:hypothetical protein
MKRIKDLTIEIQVKDSMMADIIARQDELQITELQSLRPKKVDLFPDECNNRERKISEDSLDETPNSIGIEVNCVTKDSVDGPTSFRPKKVDLLPDECNNSEREISEDSLDETPNSMTSLRPKKVDLLPDECNNGEREISEDSLDETPNSIGIEVNCVTKDSVPISEISKDSINDTRLGNDLRITELILDSSSIITGLVGTGSELAKNDVHTSEIIDSVLLTITQAKESISRKNSTISGILKEQNSHSSPEANETKQASSVQELESLFQSCIESIEGKNNLRPSVTEIHIGGLSNERIEDDNNLKIPDSDIERVLVNETKQKSVENFSSSSGHTDHIIRVPQNGEDATYSQHHSSVFDSVETKSDMLEKEEELRISVKRFGIQMDPNTQEKIIKVVPTLPKSSLPVAPQLPAKIRDRSVTLNNSAPILTKKAPILKSSSDIDKSAIPSSLSIAAPVLKGKDSTGNYPLSAAPVLTNPKVRAPATRGDQAAKSISRIPSFPSTQDVIPRNIEASSLLPNSVQRDIQTTKEKVAPVLQRKS